MDLSFSKDNKDLQDAPSKLYFSDHMIQFSEENELPKNKQNIIIFGQPVENRDVYIMERRIGCDAAAFVIKKYLNSIPFSYNENLEHVNIISMLGYFITDPMKVLSENKSAFYNKEIFSEIIRCLNSKKIDLQTTKFIDIAGSFDVLLNSVFAAIQIYSPDIILIKFSPFGYESYLAKGNLKTFHFGIDKKFGCFEPENDKNQYFFYDIEKGVKEHLTILEDVLKKHQKIIFIFDCMVFSSEYFQGTPVPFPFSYSVREMYKVFKLMNSFSNKISMLGICHFNPAVEEKKSAFFLVDLIYKFLNSFEKNKVLKDKD